MRYFCSLSYVFEIWYIFCMYGTSQFGLMTFQVLSVSSLLYYYGLIKLLRRYIKVVLLISPMSQFPIWKHPKENTKSGFCMNFFFLQIISSNLLIVFLFHSLDWSQYRHIPVNHAASNETQKCSQILTKSQVKQRVTFWLWCGTYLYFLC